MGCMACGRQLHGECESQEWAAPTGEVVPILSACCCESKTSKSGHLVSTVGEGPDSEGASGNEGAARGRPPKDDALLTDPHSSWRKRASVEFPLDREAACEWRGLADVGGGKYPIIGCTSGTQQAIHHGPVKITAGFELDGRAFDFNRGGNIHRVCARCHNLWHHWNDAPYDPAEYAILTHAPRTALPNELITWASPKTRPKAPEPKLGTFVKADD